MTTPRLCLRRKSFTTNRPSVRPKGPYGEVAGTRVTMSGLPRRIRLQRHCCGAEFGSARESAVTPGINWHRLQPLLGRKAEERLTVFNNSGSPRLEPTGITWQEVHFCRHKLAVGLSPCLNNNHLDCGAKDDAVFLCMCVIIRT